MRRILILGLGTLLAASCSSPESSGARGGADSARPNILVIISDDHGSQAISAYGSKLNQTPNLDRLAKEGMLFRNCLVTNSLCGPSRAAILTGKYSHRNGFYSNSGDRFDGRQMTFPKVLKEAGYQTAIVGKWHLESDPTGFDYWHILPGQGQYYNPPMIDNGRPVKHAGYVTDIITDLSLDWLKQKRDPQKPFLLMCHHKAPHRDWQPALRHLHRYDGVTFPEPETLFDDYAGRGTAERTQEMMIAKHLNDRDLKLVTPRDLTPEQRKEWEAAYGPANDAFRKAAPKEQDLVRWKYQRFLKEYLSTIDAVDESVGKLLGYLDETGLAKNTLVVYASDQGFFLGEHGWFDKRWIFAESLKTPLLVRWPGVVPPGTENRDMVSTLDFAETFLDAAGLAVPKEMQGRSFLPILRGGPTPSDWRQSFYYHYYEHPGPHNVRAHYGVVTDRYKLVHFYGDIDEWEFFDLEKDPHEMTSLYSLPDAQSRVRELRKELSRLQHELSDSDPEVPLAELLKREWHRKTGALEMVLSAPGKSETEWKFLDPSGKPLTAGAWCTLKGTDGVVLSQGGETTGWALWVKEGKPHFGVRNAGTMKEVASPFPLTAGRPTHLAGVLTEGMELMLYVDGVLVGRGLSHFLSSKPEQPLTIGRSSSKAVGEYEPPFRLDGELQDVRVYWGALDLPTLRTWAKK